MPGVRKLWPEAQIWLITCTYKESFIGHGKAHSFIYGLWLFSCINGRVESLQQGLYGTQSLKYLLSGTLQNKSANPWPWLHWQR